LVNQFILAVNQYCPVCGCLENGTNISRFIDRTYRRCPKCGGIYMDRTNPPPVEYGRDYFFELYKKQYGKTYIEDFPNLINMGKRRLGIIKSFLPNGGSLLDIGCAYGPFLAAAREEGFSPTGIDPAEDAVSYVQQTLGIQALKGFFPDCAISHSQNYDAVTLWYVIEHLQNCAPVFAEIRKLLKPGGLLAFSTPSFSGASGRSSLRRFLEGSPADHWTVWSPDMCAGALELAGFSVKKIVITGHHPERFPLLGKFTKGKKSLLYRPLLALSKIFAMGDTFEVYATLVSKGN
jgi:2-polyprenyl-3-methyl-5-hydroxy-6-metoxy-1,4-benzoquinol methylase